MVLYLYKKKYGEFAMGYDNVEDTKSVDELRKAQAAAQAQGVSITNYSQWEQILEDLGYCRCLSQPGTFDGDVKLHSQIMERIEAFIEETQEAQKQQEMNPKNDESSKIDNKTAQDKEHVVKANVANGTSSVILADYMKYYHMLG